jgi:hypothetical protein
VSRLVLIVLAGPAEHPGEGVWESKPRKFPLR